MIKTSIEEFDGAEVTKLLLTGELDLCENVTMRVSDVGITYVMGNTIHQVGFDELIFQPSHRKEVLYDVVKVRDKYYINIWGGMNSIKLKYYLALVTNPDLEVLKKYMIKNL